MTPTIAKTTYGLENSEKLAPANSSAEIRRLGCDELDLFREHLLRLDRATRRNRFAMPVDDAFLTSYAETSMALNPVIFGYFEDGLLRGSAELRPLADSSSAEAAFCIETGWRDCGIGTRLMGRILDEATRQRFERIYINCLATNRTMQALARKFSARFTYQDGDVIGLIKAPKGGLANALRRRLARLLWHPAPANPTALESRI
jgi:GNAT superfamily N-acetyltransferase